MVDESALAGVDGVLISHSHMDHLDRRSLGRIGGDPTLVAPAGAGRWLRRPAEQLRAGDRLQLGALTITATHAEHDGTPLSRSAPRSPALGYRIDGSRSVFFAGDTDLFDGMAEIGRPSLDLALLPVSGWGPRLGPGHLDPAAAARALELLRPAARGADPLGHAVVAGDGGRPRPRLGAGTAVRRPGRRPRAGGAGGRAGAGRVARALAQAAATTRKPMLPAEASGVLALRASTR